MSKEILKSFLEEIGKEDDFLDLLLAYEENKSTIITKEFLKLLKDKNINREREYIEFKTVLNETLPKRFKNQKHKIIDAFNKFDDAVSEENIFYNEQYYKSGFKKRIKFMFKLFQIR